MRIVYLLSAMGHTGGSLVLYHFMDELVKRGHDVFVTLPAGSFPWRQGCWEKVVSGKGYAQLLSSLTGNVLRRLGAAGDVVRRALGRAPIDSISQFAWMTKCLLKHAPEADIYVATHCTTALACYVLSRRAKGLYHAQHFESIFFDDAIGQALAEATYFLPLELVANSSWLCRRLESLLGKEPRLLLPGIDATTFRPWKDIEQKYRETERLVVVSYYSPLRFKAWEEAVEAMKKVFEVLGRGRVEWRVFGGRPVRTPELPVKFVGKVMGVDLARLYSEAHVVFMNSWCESFPLPPLEGMACGTAVVCTPVGTEDYAVDTVNCLWVEPRRPEELAKAIIRIARDPELAIRLALNGISTAKRFDWDAAGRRLIEILKECQAQPA